MRMKNNLAVALGMEGLRFHFPGGAFLCLTCGSVNTTEAEVDECQASHPPDVPPTNEDR